MTSMLSAHDRELIGALAAQGGSIREMYKEARERDLQEQARQRERDLHEQAQRDEQELQQLSHRRDDDDYVPWRHRGRRRDYYAPPATRQFTAKDIADFEKAEEFYELQSIAREVRKREFLVQSIENLMSRDVQSYWNSGLPQMYSKLTGADKDAESRK